MFDEIYFNFMHEIVRKANLMDIFRFTANSMQSLGEFQHDSYAPYIADLAEATYGIGFEEHLPNGLYRNKILFIL